MMVKCEFRGGSELSSVASSAVIITDDDDIHEGEELFFLKGAWEQVLDLCQYVHLPPANASDASSESQTPAGQSMPLTESKKKEIGQLLIH